jgi:hypothetical protein
MKIIDQLVDFGLFRQSWAEKRDFIQGLLSGKVDQKLKTNSNKL